jgi:hypothetical protein
VLAPPEEVIRWIAAAADRLPAEPVLVGKTSHRVSAHMYKWSAWRAGIADLAAVVDEASKGQRGGQFFLCSTGLTDVDRVRDGEQVDLLGINGCLDFTWSFEERAHGLAPLLAGHTPVIVNSRTGERVRHADYAVAFDEFVRQVRRSCVSVAEHEVFFSSGYVYRELVS